jgi:2-hydroxycyclohexanecarboxyl-CoA dehydrogenase
MMPAWRQGETATMHRFGGKKAVVMGASRPQNMGQAIARRLIAEGVEVVSTATPRPVSIVFVSCANGRRMPA